MQPAMMGGAQGDEVLELVFSTPGSLDQVMDIEKTCLGAALTSGIDMATTVRVSLEHQIIF